MRKELDDEIEHHQGFRDDIPLFLWAFTPFVVLYGNNVQPPKRAKLNATILPAQLSILLEATMSLMMVILKRLCIVLISSVTVASCVGTLTKVSGMNAADIRNVSEDDLCFTYAMNIKKRIVAPNVDAEVKRRGLTCAYRMETLLSDCSMLRIVDWGAHPPDSNITVVTVQNLSDRKKQFRVSLGNIASTLLKSAPGTTQSYGIVVSKEMDTVATVVGAAQGLTRQPPELYECKTD